MKKIIALFLIALMPMQFLHAVDDTFIDYQNYNHGYCPSCNYCPCSCENANPQPCAQEQASCAPCNAPTPAPCGPCDAPTATPCGPADPCAPVCGTECGISICAITLGVAAIAAAGAIIIASSNGGASSTH